MAVLLLAVFAGSAALRNASAQGVGVVINEVELNPKGQDAGNEWIGIYNPTGADIDIGNFKVLMTTSSSTITIPMPTGATVAAGGFYILEVRYQLLANAGMLTLVDSAGQAVDRTPSLVDRSDDSRTWQRIPDGGSQWKFVEGSKGKPNDPSTYRGKSSGSESNQSQSTNTNGLCAGSAMCIQGTVVRVSDANVVYVQQGNEKYQVTLSLTKAMAKSGRALTRALCLGTTALVDQDDKQPGRSKNIVGVVYCDSQNLNQQLLDSGIVRVDIRQCMTSEFASQSWAKKYC